MTREEAIDSLNEVYVVLATTRIRGIPTEIELGHEDGMPRDCVLNAITRTPLPRGTWSSESRCFRRRSLLPSALR